MLTCNVVTCKKEHKRSPLKNVSNMVFNERILQITTLKSKIDLRYPVGKKTSSPFLIESSVNTNAVLY